MLLYPQGQVIEELLRRGHSVCAINCVSAVQVPSEPKVGDLSLEYIEGEKKLNLRAIQQLRDIIRTFRPDVIHAFTTFTLAWSLFATSRMARSQKRPSIVSFRGITRPLKRWDPSDWMSFKHPRVSWHACESEAVQQSMLRSGCDANRCNVVYNCATPAAPCESRDAIRAQWRLSKDDFVVGTVAMIRPVKGLDILLDSAIRLDNSRMRWVIIGSGNDPATDELARHPKVAKDLRMLGKINSAANYLHAFDLFVMPSRSEGLCRSLIEAMEQGLPSVVSDAGGMKELIRHGQDGLVVPKENPEALANAIQRLYEDEPLRKSMGQSARARAAELCSATVFTDRLEAIYQRVVEPKLSAMRAIA
ncbi:MAG: glycosyltransferase family 4 protein [Pirellula sp.]|jgi:glycosyltransferase involved in cell wall biosynthesis|nr:glycosyltransferase family 4 protein [Pirellula sp.]